MQIAVCTTGTDPLAVLPGLGSLAHGVRLQPLEAVLATAREPEPTSRPMVRDVWAVVVDTAAAGLLEARELCAVLARRHPGPVLAVVEEGALITVDHRWGPVDVLLPAATPTEIEFRLRMASARHRRRSQRTGRWFLGPLTLDSRHRRAWLADRRLGVAGPAFELLCELAAHPGRVQRRDDLLVKVWGSPWHDPALVDAHIRRLRGAMGAHGSAISTVRNVGYRLDPERLGPPADPP